MDTFQNWAFSVCCAAIFGGILNFLLPESGTQKIYKTVFCVFFLCVIVSPLSEIDFKKLDFINQDFNNSSNSADGNEFNRFTAEYIEKEIINSVNQVMNEENLDFDDISVKVNILEDGSINITKFALTFKTLENPDSLKEKIRQKTGVLPEITVSGEN